MSEQTMVDRLKAAIVQEHFAWDRRKDFMTQIDLALLAGAAIGYKLALADQVAELKQDAQCKETVAQDPHAQG